MNKATIYISDVLDGNKRHNNADGQILSQILTIINRKHDMEIFEYEMKYLIQNGKIEREWGEAVQQLLRYHTDTMDEEKPPRGAGKGRSYLHNGVFASR